MTAPSKTLQITTRSGNEDSDILSLTSRINSLSQEEKWWHDLALKLIGAAVVVSLLLFLAQHRETSRTRERADAESELNKVKDRKLALELAARDLNISAADERAGKANERAAALEVQSKEARVAIATAQAEAAKATERAALAESHLADSQAKARLAEQHAKEADAKAESFRLDIAKAQESAARAQAQVAGATAEAAKANLELARIKSPRTLSDADGLIKDLSVFKGTEYTFSSVAPEEESINLLKSIDEVLQHAEWKRISSGGFPAIKIYGKDDFVVSEAILDGIRIEVELPNAPVNEAIPLEKMPVSVRAAVALNIGLFPESLHEKLKHPHSRAL